MTTIDDYQSSVGFNTWKATMYYADRLEARRIRIAFFSSTPQGGGVALMRHALVRFLTLIGLDAQW